MIDDVPTAPPIVILRLRNMTALDATGMAAIEALAEGLRTSGRHLLVCGTRRQPARLLERGEFHEAVGEENILPNVHAALERARALHAARVASEAEAPRLSA